MSLLEPGVLRRLLEFRGNFATLEEAILMIEQ
jgi:hypothetical protein